MASSKVKKAENLIMELDSLETCDAVNNRIGAYNLLNEVLKDARSLAIETIQTETARILRNEIEMRTRNFKARPRVRLVTDNIDIKRANEYSNVYDLTARTRETIGKTRAIIAKTEELSNKFNKMNGTDNS